jgi:hypothetical protein
MARQSRRDRIGSEFNLGGEQAEADPLLNDAFVETSDFSALLSDRDPRCFIIARTGGGKSAALQGLEEKRPEHVIRISPEDLSLPYVTDLNVFRFLDGLGVNLDIFFIALWKHVLLVEIIRHRYKVDSPDAKQNFLANLREKVARDPAKLAALAYLNDFGGKFWCEADERVREITDRFQGTIDRAAGVDIGWPGLSASLSAGAVDTMSTEVRVELVNRYQRVVNDFQLARLNKMIAVLDENMLDTAHHRTYVVIDDLDRDWVAARVANDLIRCLFRAVLDLKRVRHLKVLVALRTNIFEQLDFGSRPGAQEEKLRSLILPLHWNKHSISAVLEARADVAAKLSNAPSLGSLKTLLPNANKARGNPLDFILDRTLMRPRDAIAYVNASLSLARDETRVTWNHILSAEHAYSEGRLQALRDEWKPSYPDIDKALNVFRRHRVPLARADFIDRLHEMMLLSADRNFRGVAWLTDLSLGYWTSPLADDDWTVSYQPLTKFLHAIGFIGVAKSKSYPPTYSHEDASVIDRPENVGEAFFFWVHPTFWSALEITSSRVSALR